MFRRPVRVFTAVLAVNVKPSQTGADRPQKTPAVELNQFRGSESDVRGAEGQSVLLRPIGQKCFLQPKRRGLEASGIHLGSAYLGSTWDPLGIFGRPPRGRRSAEGEKAERIRLNKS